MSEHTSLFQKAGTATVVPVVETMPGDLLTPLGVYLVLSENSTNSFLFESVEGGTSLARYSFIGADPDFVLCGSDESIHISRGADSETLAMGVTDYLREHFFQRPAVTDPDLPSFIGGAIGYLEFGCTEWFEPHLKSKGPARENTAKLMLFSSIVAFDHAQQVIKIISLVFTDGTEADAELEQKFEAARSRNVEIRKALGRGRSSVTNSVAPGPSAAVDSNWNRPDFEVAVSRIKEMINAGECYQVVLSQCFTRRTNASPVSIYRAIRSLNPSPYMFLLQFDGQAVVGASPEMLVRCEGRRLEYRPIAGTRRRGRNAAEDEALAEEMRSDKKEVAEHVMLVDLGRNDLGRVAEYGSVRVDSLMSVEKYSHVQHLVSSLSARLREGLDRFDVLAACFPAGTVSGAPKVRAIEIIREIEPTERGVYAGAVGYFDYSGNMDTCIAIRTLVLEGGLAKIQAGAGIVADSVPELEFDETVNKAAMLLSAIDIAEGGTN
jgi:anthranilate synthase component I